MTASSTFTASPRSPRLTRSLGVLSAGLGIPALVQPARIARLIGAPNNQRNRTVTAAVGARELVHAAGLMHPRWGPRWTWTRVAGDALDLALLRRTVRDAGR